MTTLWMIVIPDEVKLSANPLHFLRVLQPSKRLHVKEQFPLMTRVCKLEDSIKYVMNRKDHSQ